MKLVVGSRGNYRSTRSIIDKTGEGISEIYMSVDNAQWGSGRNYVHHVDFQEAARQVSHARRHGIDLSLAFNTVCFGQEKFKEDFLQRFTRLISMMEKAGFSNVILSDPYLMEIVKDEFPGLGVIVSVFAEVDSENRLAFYNDLGVDRIIIPHELNRNLAKLEKFSKMSSCPLEVILNLGCTHYCARADAHSSFTGHYCGSVMQMVMGDYYTTYCNHRKLTQPWEFLCQDWIRPEDVYRYENLGVQYFKLAGRATATGWIIRAAKAYLERSYEGDLQDLISSYYPLIKRAEGEKSPMSPIPNKALEPYMDELYNCGHQCDRCERCRKFYQEITGKAHSEQVLTG